MTKRKYDMKRHAAKRIYTSWVKLQLALMKKAQSAPLFSAAYMAYLKWIPVRKSPVMVKREKVSARAILTYFTCEKNLPVTSITQDHILSFIQWRKYHAFSHNMRLSTVAPATINRDLMSLSYFFDKLVKENTIQRNPVNGCVLPLQNERVVYLHEPQVIELLSKSTPYMNKIIKIAIMFGLRLDSITNMRWSDIDLKSGIMRVLAKNTKGKRILILPIHPCLHEHLKNWKNESGIDEYVISHHGQKIKTFKKAWQRLRNKLTFRKLPDGSFFRFHDLRHCFASYLRMSGFQLHEIKELLGHKSENMTLRYAHLDVTRLQDKLEMINHIVDFEKMKN